MQLSKALPMLSWQQKQAISDVSLAYWADEFIRLDNGLKFSFDTHKYLLKVYQDESPKQVHMKATQMGLTTWAMLKSIHSCKTKFPLGVIYFFPTDHDVSDFSKGRMNPMIEQNQSIKDIMLNTDEVGIKKVGKSYMYFRGMRSATQVKSVPADMIVLDEKDEAEPEMCDMARKRLSASEYQWEINLSNPTIPNYGIDVDFQESDQKYWLIKCEHCGVYNCLEETFPNCLIKVNNIIIISCKNCKKQLNIQNGEWVAKYPDNKDISGYHYTQLFSSTVKPADILKEYNKAIQQGRLSTFYNLTLGLPYITSKEKLSPSMLYGLCDSDFTDKPFEGQCKIFMGVDQGKGLHIVFKRLKGEKVLTWFTEEIDFEQLDKYIKMGVTRCVVDALPETRKASEFAKRHPGIVYLNYYNENQKGGYKWDDEKCIVQENRTESLDASHSYYTSERIVLPRRSNETEEFIQHLCNTAKRLEENVDTGSKRYIWIKLGADHYRHADNYAYIAMSAFVEDDNEPYEVITHESKSDNIYEEEII